MRIGIDTTFLFDQYANRGIGSYSKEVTKRMLQNPNHTWVLFGFENLKVNLAELGLKKLSQVEFVSLGKKRMSNPLNLLYFKLFYLKKIKKAKLDLYFETNFEKGLPIRKVKTVVVVHDIIPYLTNSYSQKGKIFNFFKGLFYRYNLERSKKADIILTHSEFTKRELVHKGGFEESKIRQIYSGIQENFREKNISKNTREIRRVLVMYKITLPYVLYYGGMEANKNITNLLLAFNKVTTRHPDLKLVLVGKEFKVGWDNKPHPQTKSAEKVLELIEDLKLKHKVILTGEAQEHHLPIIMNNALCFVHLSTYEGFGLAVLEGLASGTPVIASRRSSYPEILQDGAKFVNPFDVEKISASLLEILQDNLKTTALIKKGQKVSEQYSWDITTEKTINEFSKLVGEIKPLNICYVIQNFYPIKGGAENNCLGIAKEMVRHGHKVTVLTANTKDEKYPKFEEYEGIKIYRFKKINDQYYFGIYPGLFWGLLRQRADIIHVHGFGFIWQDFCLKFKKLFSRKVKFVNTPHGPFMTLKNYTLKEKVLKTTYTFVQKLFLNRLYHLIIQVNPFQYKWIQNYGISEKKIEYIPNGLPAEFFEATESNEKYTDLGLNRKFVISFMGRFEEYKGFQFIVEALPELLKTKHNLFLVGIGNMGSYYEKINERIKKLKLEKKIKLFVTPDDETRNYLLEQSQIFIMPSEWEAFGLAMLEAMAKKNAIITTRTEGGEFLIKEEENGYLFDYGDVKELTALILKLINNKIILGKMKTNNFEKAQKFTWDKIVMNYQKLLLDLNK